jgi:hypothetical protein
MSHSHQPVGADPVVVALLAACWAGLCAVTFAYLGRT